MDRVGKKVINQSFVHNLVILRVVSGESVNGSLATASEACRPLIGQSNSDATVRAMDTVDLSASTSERPAHPLLDTKAVGQLLGCSWQTVLRLADSGKIPWGVKLGALRPWDAAQIQTLIAEGCKPPTRKGGRH